MMTKREFYKSKEHEAFETAMSICQGRRKYEESYRSIFTADVAAEANLIIEEWWQDYREEHV
jgi:hypothetical protein